MSNTPINCSFCGRSKEDVDVLIAGVTGHICDHCIEQPLPPTAALTPTLGPTIPKEAPSAIPWWPLVLVPLVLLVILIAFLSRRRR